MPCYVALIDGETGNFGVVVPDLPGCTSAGGTIEEALSNAADAVRLWCEDARADGEAIPAPRSISEIISDSEIAAALSGGAMMAVVRDRELVT
jgi:predicted RNase H-like HicB family nuclease